jgi:hypothetical protein
MKVQTPQGTSALPPTDQETWLWFVVIPNRDGGTIGAAATEMDAMREACESIDEMSEQHRGGAAIWRVTAGSASTPRLHQFHSTILARWEGSLACLEQYLAGGTGAQA